MARSNANCVDIPTHSFNNRGVMTLNKNRIILDMHTTLNINKAITTFENQYKTDSLSGKNLEAYNVLKDKIQKVKTIMMLSSKKVKRLLTV